MSSETQLASAVLRRKGNEEFGRCDRSTNYQGKRVILQNALKMSPSGGCCMLDHYKNAARCAQRVSQSVDQSTHTL